MALSVGRGRLRRSPSYGMLLSPMEGVNWSSFQSRCLVRSEGEAVVGGESGHSETEPTGREYTHAFFMDNLDPK